MATTYMDKQAAGGTAVSVYSTLYNTAGATTAVVSAIHICNEAATDATVRIGLAATAGTPASGSFLAYDWIIPPTTTVTWNGPLTLGNTKYIRCSSSATTVSFTAAVAEVS